MCEPKNTKGGGLLASEIVRGGYSAAASSSSLLAKLYIGSLPESIIQPRTLLVSRAVAGSIPCRTE